MSEKDQDKQDVNPAAAPEQLSDAALDGVAGGTVGQVPGALPGGGIVRPTPTPHGGTGN